MAEKSKALELKVGIFVFIGILILAWFVLLIGSLKLLRVGYDIKVTFGFANGIRTNYHGCALIKYEFWFCVITEVL